MSTYVKDIGERVLLTAAQAFLAVFVVTDLSSAKAAGIAAAAAVLALAKGLVAQAVGDPGTASLTV